MRVLSTLLILMTLAACGADGAPTAPSAAPTTGVTISGDARLGVTVTN